MKSILAIVLAGLAASGCATIRVHQTPQTEEILSAAGFVMKPADTPERRADLQAFTPRTIVRHERDGQARYVYADPTRASACTSATKRSSRRTTS